MPSSINKQLRDKGLVPDEAFVHLKYVENVRLIHCMYCCKGLIKQQARIFELFEVEPPEQPTFMSIPMGMQCPRCGAIWNFSTINR